MTAPTLVASRPVPGDGHRGPAAVLLGDSMDMACALRLAGARTTVVGGAHAPARYSRHGYAWLSDPRPGDQHLVTRLRALTSATQPRALFYETDRDLLFVSRNRAQLGPGLPMLLPAARVVEELVDKAAFRVLAEDAGLPVPASWVVGTSGPLPRVGAGYPLLVKPLVRDERWGVAALGQKAVAVADERQLRALLDALSGAFASLLVQAYVQGPESQVESYHVYADASGRIAAEFTGRKIRTLPLRNGFSTALATTSASDVRDLGRSIVRTLGLVGVAKLDMKRDEHGRLWLLEINPRFNLWHHLGAAAGVNIPAVVLADLTGRPRPPTVTARPGVTWCNAPKDCVAAWQDGVGLLQWWRWARRCDARTGFEPFDPLPFLRGRVWPRLLEGARRPGS